jgi:Phytanoyl-CoA dioxygenase (PhyH)
MRLLKRRPKATPDLRTEIDRLTEANRAHRDPETERRLLRLRHEAAIELLDAAGPSPGWPEPEADRLPASEGLPELAAADLTPGLVRAGILRDGCLLVRGLVAREEALRFAADIDRAFEARERREAGATSDPGLYDEFLPDPRFEPTGVRDWVKLGGGVLAADSPTLTFRMMELLQEAGFPALVEGYLGEPGLISLHKTTLRKADPSVPGAWHQDGAFMGPVRALNLWLSLSRCGDEAPGLDLVPRRLDRIVATQTDEAVLDYQVSQAKAEEAAGEKGIVRPIFEPGDALLFDELFLHQTGSDPEMPKPRFALENWFFGPSAFPDDYAPLAV